MVEMVLIVAHGFFFLGLEGAHALKHFVEIHLMAVELGTIHADEAGLSAYGHSAGTAHAEGQR